MDARSGLTALGAGLTTALVVAVAVIEGLAVDFSALVGLPLGLLAGLVVLVVVATTFGGLSQPVKRTVSAYAAFGLALLGLVTLSYVNITRGLLSTAESIGVAAVVAVLTYLGFWLQERDREAEQSRM